MAKPRVHEPPPAGTDPLVKVVLREGPSASPLGLSTAEMASICGTSEAVIRARVADLRKAAQSGAKEQE